MNFKVNLRLGIDDVDVSRRTGFGVIIPYQTSWTIIHKDISPQITLDELMGIRMGEKQFPCYQSCCRARVLQSVKS